jgi:hypothetical protein
MTVVRGKAARGRRDGGERRRGWDVSGLLAAREREEEVDMWVLSVPHQNLSQNRGVILL